MLCRQEENTGDEALGSVDMFDMSNQTLLARGVQMSVALDMSNQILLARRVHQMSVESKTYFNFVHVVDVDIVTCHLMFLELN
eukprot:scaffold2153_cov131-Cylindrotheca_fusiformis.AAC.3